jgi:hypothetical protein
MQYNRTFSSSVTTVNANGRISFWFGGASDITYWIADVEVLTGSGIELLPDVSKVGARGCAPPRCDKPQLVADIPTIHSCWYNTRHHRLLPPPPPVLQREFECGAVFLNADSIAHSFTIPAGYAHIGSVNTDKEQHASKNASKGTVGMQAPRYQYIVDDHDERCGDR